MGPAYRIETERLVIRCYDPGDAPLLDAALTVSVEHLKPWMPWVHEEPQSLDKRVELLRTLRARFDANSDFNYGIFDRGESELIGAIGSHTRQGPGIRELGYWIRADRLRRGFATESVAAMTRVALEVDRVRRVEIRCDTKNLASACVPKKVGFVREGVLRRQLMYFAFPRDAEIWSMVAEDYEASLASSAAVRAYDAMMCVLLE
jgi:RimJ/RimL family protein N-acetyltransferase